MQPSYEAYTNYVATPHGSDKNATQENWDVALELFVVATPHGSDKNAT